MVWHFIHWICWAALGSIGWILICIPYIGNWESILLLLSYYLDLHIVHKSHYFAELIFLLHHFINLLRILGVDIQHFHLSFFSASFLLLQKNISKMSKGEPEPLPAPPSLIVHFPPLLYNSLFFASESTSEAWEIYLNLSPFVFLSGHYFKANFLKAFFNFSRWY